MSSFVKAASGTGKTSTAAQGYRLSWCRLSPDCTNEPILHLQWPPGDPIKHRPGKECVDCCKHLGFWAHTKNVSTGLEGRGNQNLAIYFS